MSNLVTNISQLAHNPAIKEYYLEYTSFNLPGLSYLSTINEPFQEQF